MKSYKYLFIIGFILKASYTFAQVNTFTGNTYALTGNQGNKEYLAKETITLSNGFHVKASTDGKFRAAIQDHVAPQKPASEAVNNVKTEFAAISGLTTGLALMNAIEGSQKHTVTGFMDGTGRAIQSIATQSTDNAGASIVQPYEYDAYGRQLKQYLAYPEDGSTASYNPSAITNQALFYSAGTPGLESDGKPFGKADFDDSPLSRLLGSTVPGSDWHDNNKNKGVDVGLDNSGAIRKWTIGTGGTPVTGSTYPARYLYYSEITNEEGRKIRNYMDPLGNLILSESKGTDGSIHRTYYAYDVFNNLLSVIPPSAVKLASTASWNLTVSDANDLCFIYTYDEQNRLIERKNPGIEPVYFVYDYWHRLILSQDGNQRNASPDEWTFLKYDAFDRPIAVGVYKSNSSRAALASTVLGSAFGHHEDTNSSAAGYTLNLSFPNTVTESDLLQITYYDNYGFVNNPGWDVEGHNYAYTPPSGFTTTASNAVLDLVTGSKVRILDSPKWLNTVIHYDEKYRAIQVVKENHLGGLDKSSILYNDFKGTVQKTYFDHYSTGDSFTMLETYEYDNNDRLVNKWRKVGTGATVLAENYQYNKLGQLIERNIHSTDNGVSFLQSVDFTYNVRGWLTGINESGLSSNTDANALDDLFGISLNYTTTGIQVNAQPVTPKYDGSISSASWKNQHPDKTDKEHIYGYGYDAQGRIVNADYAIKSSGAWTGDAGMYDTQYTYKDENGNLQTIKRNAEKGGVLTEIDDIILDYINNSNQLEDVSDSQSDTGFKDGVTMTTEYTYDDNGNMLSDLNAEITDIRYNILNRPERITIGKTSGDVYISNVYDALGNKLRMEVEENNTIVMSVDYSSGIHYVDDQLAYARTQEGRILRYGSNYEHEYSVVDHQGNIRTTFGMLHDTDVYYATMETERATEEQAVFENMATDFVSLYNHTKPTIDLPTPDRSKFISPGSAGDIGPAIAIPVNGGDKISAEIFALFDNGSASNNSSAPAGVLEAVAGSFGTASGEALYGQFSNAISSLVSGWSNASNVTPDAYLNLIWVNTTNTSNSIAYDKVEPTAYTNYEPLNVEFTAPGAGTVFIYVANESDQSNTNLFLDDFLVVHEKTTSSLNVVSTSNYYPFGMKMDAESYDDVNREKQRYGYNGNEEIAVGGLTLMDFNARIYNPSLGRFMGADALASITAASSPYAFTSNDPINLVDPTGLTERKFGDRVKHYRRIFTREGSFFQRPLYWGRTGPGSSHHWTDQFRSVEANFGLMSFDTFREYYGLIDEFGLPNYEMVGQLVNILAESGVLGTTRYSVGVNGLGDGNGNIIPGTEEYQLYVDNQANEGIDLLQLGKDVSFYGGIQSGFLFDQSVDIALREGRGRYEGPKEFLRKQTNLKSISKITKGVSGAFTTLSVVTSFAEFAASDQSGADYARLIGAGVIIGTNFIPYAGPFISTALAIGDATGQFDFFYAGFDNPIYRSMFFNSLLSGGRTTVGPFKP